MRRGTPRRISDSRPGERLARARALLDVGWPALALALRATAQATPWPDLNEDEDEGLIEQYSSPEWVEYR